jgi:ABC-type transport system involved in multi-copper enzyme maturation permease subunit
VTTPSGLLTAEAERGTMELLLARPITRFRIYLLAAIIPILGQAALVGVIFSGTVIWTRFFDYGQEVELLPFALVSINIALSACAVVGISLLAAAYFNERGRAIGVVVGYLVASYLADFSAVWWPRMAAVHPWTIFYYSVPNRVLRAEALSPRDVAVLGTVLVVTAVAGFLIWRRKDLAAA